MQVKRSLSGYTERGPNQCRHGATVREKKEKGKGKEKCKGKGTGRGRVRGREMGRGKGKKERKREGGTGMGTGSGQARGRAVKKRQAGRNTNRDNDLIIMRMLCGSYAGSGGVVFDRAWGSGWRSNELSNQSSHHIL